MKRIWRLIASKQSVDRVKILDEVEISWVRILGVNTKKNQNESAKHIQIVREKKESRTVPYGKCL